MHRGLLIAVGGAAVVAAVMVQGGEVRAPSLEPAVNRLRSRWPAARGILTADAAAGALAVFGAAVTILALRERGRPQHAEKPGYLEQVVLSLGGGMPFTLKMATEGVFCCAELGWGKTFLVFKLYLDAYVRAGGGCILGAKAEDLPMVQEVFRRARALDRLIVLGPRHAGRVNWFESLARIAPKGSETEEIVGALASLMEVEDRKANKGGGEDSHFFKTHAMLVLASIITGLRLAGEVIDASKIYRFLTSLPVSPEQIASEEWRANSYCNQCMAKAYGRIETAEERADWEHSSRYLYVELVDLNSRTRSSIVSSVSAMVSKLVRGWMGQLWSTGTNVRFESAFDGRWFYLDTSPLEYGEYGTYSLVMGKHLFQRMVMRRKINRDSRAVALMFDEAQGVLVTADREYQAVCRSKLGISWAASQNLTGLFAALGGDQAAESHVKSWIALFGCKIFGANTCWDTNTFASQLCGQELRSMGSGNVSHQGNELPWDLCLGRPNTSSGWSEQYIPVVRPEEWVRLRKPEPPSYEAEAIVVMSRLRETLGRHWAKVSFRPGQ